MDSREGAAVAGGSDRFAFGENWSRFLALLDDERIALAERSLRDLLEVDGLRGMSPWRDAIDWIGGLPFEVARPEEIFRRYRERGFLLVNLKTCAGGHGCNEYVFNRAV